MEQSKREMHAYLRSFSSTECDEGAEIRMIV
jgi:hypothetical protein